MSTSCYERGLQYLLSFSPEITGKKLCGLTGGMVLRTLQVHLGEDLGSRLSLDTWISCEEGDICSFMAKMWTHDFLLDESLGILNEDGGWAMECGGASDPSATILGLSYLLDAAGSWNLEIIDEGLEYVLGACGADDDIFQFALPDGCGHGGLGGRLEFLVLLSQLWREGKLDNLQQERRVREYCQELRRLIGEVGPGSSCYEVGLCLRSMGLLGIREGRSDLVEWLHAHQQADGSWEDSMYGSDLTVTCVVLDGLAAAQAGQEDVTFQVHYQEQRESGLSNPVSDSLEGNIMGIEVTGEPLRSVSVSVYNEEGKSMVSFGTDLVGRRYPIWYRDWIPGTYDVVVRKWSRPGLGYLGESHCELNVPYWADIKELELQVGEPDKVFQMGEETTLSPRIIITLLSNGGGEGVVRCQFKKADNLVLHDFGEQRFESVAGRLQVPVSSGGWPYSFPEYGYYVMVAEVELNGKIRSVQRLIHVFSNYTVEAHNDLPVSKLDLEQRVGSVRFRLSTPCPQSVGLPARYESHHPSDVVADMDLSSVITLEGITDMHGREVVDGWVVIRADKGRCSGGRLVGPESGSQRFRAYPVKNGICSFNYTPGVTWCDSVTSLALFAACEIRGGIIQMERIGVVELRLRSKLDWWDSMDFGCPF